VEIVKMDDEKLYLCDDVLEEASAASHQMLPKKSKLRFRTNWKNLRVNENQWVKDSERKRTKEKPSPNGNYFWNVLIFKNLATKVLLKKSK
jgi:hypothetical protein